VHEGTGDYTSMTSNQISLKNETELNALLESHSGSVKILYGVLLESGRDEWYEGNGPGRTRVYRKTYPIRCDMCRLNADVAS
jgi:hypothetical protein